MLYEDGDPCLTVAQWSVDGGIGEFKNNINYGRTVIVSVSKPIKVTPKSSDR